MDFFVNLLDKIVSIYDGYVFILMLFISLTLLLVDAPKLHKNKYKGESKAAKSLGYVYLTVGTLLFILSIVL